MEHHKRHRRWNPNEVRWAYFFLLPGILGILAFLAVPVVESFVLSFFKYDVLTPARFIGVQNYIDLVHDSYNWNSLKNTAYYTVGVIPPSIILSLLLAILVNQKLSRGEKLIYRAIIYLPVITSTVAVSIVWSWLYDPVNGYIRRFSGSTGRTGWGVGLGDARHHNDERVERAGVQHGDLPGRSAVGP